MADNERKRALITGVTGQDGSYLAELLLDEGYHVFGLVRRDDAAQRLSTLSGALARALGDGRLELVRGELTDSDTLQRVLETTRPEEVYNLAARSYVGAAWRDPVAMADVCALGTLRLFEALREVAPAARVFQASSAAIYGRSGDAPYSETTPFRPKGPYGVAKLFAHWTAVDYREAHGLFAVCGILFNHESPRRSPEFVTRKITRAAARIAHGLESELALGDLEPRRDWGFAGDYVRAMWLALQADEPDDYVFATGVGHSVRELCEVAFAAVGLDWHEYVRRDEQLVRPAELDVLVGDPAKAHAQLGWRPDVSFEELVRDMVAADREAAALEA